MSESTVLPDVTGVILTGGLGRRFNGQDKGLLQLDGRALVEHVGARLNPQVNQLYVNANRNTERYRQLGYEVIVDDIEGYAGPLAGISVALRHAGSQWLCVTPCDCPLIPLNLVSMLYARANVEGADLAYLVAAGIDQPLLALAKTTLSPSLDAFLNDGGRRVMDFYAIKNAARCEVETPIVNINNADELAKFVSDNRP